MPFRGVLVASLALILTGNTFQTLVHRSFSGGGPHRSVSGGGQQFAAAVDLVQVEVSVTDRAGRPLTDLTAADFDLSEDGRPQTIQALFLTTMDRALVTAAATRGSGPAPATEVRELKQRVFIFVLDTVHMSPAGFTRSRDAVQRFLQTRLTPADVVGVVANGQMLGNRIGSDRETLLNALAAIKSPTPSRMAEMRSFPRLIDDVEVAKIARNDERTIDNAAERACREQPGECRAAAGDGVVRQEIEAKAAHLYGQIQRDTGLTLTAIQSLATGLARLPGPKFVAVFSEGFYTDEVTDWLQNIVGLAARSGVRFFTLDARGIGKDLRSQTFLDGAPVTSTGDTTPIDTDANADVLTQLALDTGGDRVFNVNNFDEPLDRIAREIGTYYVLGYRPDKAFDGSYRRLKVTVRRPDAIVHARRGYIARAVTTDPLASGSSNPASSASAMPGLPVSTSPPSLEALGLAVGRSGIGAPPAPDDFGRASRPNSVALVSGLAANAETTTASNADAARLAHEGWQRYAKGEVEAAREMLARAAQAAPQLAWIQYALGQSEFTLQHMQAAASSFEHVRASLPDYEPVYFDLADAYLQLHRQSDALSVLRDAAQRWPTDPETHLAVGCVLVARSAFEDAADAFSRATKLAPDNAVAFFNLGRAYHLIYIRLVRSSTSSATAASMLADRNRQLAIDAYRKCLAIGSPFDADARQALSVLGWKSGQ